ncbi:bifunctional aspartate kinase/homoserine dehydrogenase I [Flavobacteriaceae bacterium]|nr:bifunctional aspartate kinase/homoserine dehydrogenase I [Flavobacteriaceae bacterium]MDB4182722.1 bifunctional aspartate kinase/homoserine dehydrogenase I [Flavobacteriaceae bacterium]
MKVLKFGGTSVGSAKNISKVIKIVREESATENIAVVVSAVGGITDKLLIAADKAINKDHSYKQDFEALRLKHIEVIDGLLSGEVHEITTDIVLNHLTKLEKLLDGVYLINELSPKTTDKLLSFGELISSLIIYEAMKSKGINVQLKNSQNLIVTDSNFTNAAVNFEETNANITTYFESNKKMVTILPGFISKSENDEITTLGRGGSDYTAAILAAALNASVLQIWTDVSGMFTTNPKMVKNAKPINKLSYLEAIELSHFGAKVLYPPTVQPVLRKDIPLLIKNTLAPKDPGTLITKIVENGHQSPIKGISNINDVSLLTLQGNGMVGIPGFSKRLFETLAHSKINVIIITQASSEHSICIGIADKDAPLAKAVIDKEFENEISLFKIDPLGIESHLSIVAVIGDKMKSHQGISGKMFSTLGKNNVNIRAIAQGASERNITAVISESDVKKALNCLHEQFFEEETKEVNLFIAGVGNVGKSLIEQIKQQQKYIKSTLKIKLKVIALSNSRTMVFDENGLDLEDWESVLKNGQPTEPMAFFEATKNLNLRNSIFIDITANEAIANTYSHYLKQSISVVACNKIACSSTVDNYKELKQLSHKYNVPFLFETNVGAGLPVIDTLKHLINSGDKVHTINAVLSGSLNFIFNNFNKNTTFHDVVKQAQAEGFTEPDPRIDLSGVDVARKLLILARESGEMLEMDAIENDPFLPKECMEAASVELFYETLKTNEAVFQKLFSLAESNQCKLKYVAAFKDGKSKVGLQEIPAGHPFYNLEGKDNIVMFYTNRYTDQPMIIKGAGAGSEVTASGLFADIIRISNTN